MRSHTMEAKNKQMQAINITEWRKPWIYSSLDALWACRDGKMVSVMEWAANNMVYFCKSVVFMWFKECGVLNAVFSFSLSSLTGTRIKSYFFMPFIFRTIPDTIHSGYEYFLSEINSCLCFRTTGFRPLCLC